MNHSDLFEVRKSLFALIVMFFFGCQSKKADLILFNANVITLDEVGSTASAIAISGNKILSIGPNDEVLKTKTSSTVLMDVSGNTIMPGINEGHAHIFPASWSENKEPLPVLEDLNDLLSWISEKSKNLDSGEWIIHPKFFATRLQEMRPPTLIELDSVAPNHPVFLDGSYAALVNTRAIEICNLRKQTENQFILSDSSGEPSGVVIRPAYPLVQQYIPKLELSNTKKLKALQNLIAKYNEVGITSVGSGSGHTGFFDLASQLDIEGNLNVRISQNIYAPFDAHSDSLTISKYLDSLTYRSGGGNEMVRYGAIKVLVDGGILTGTAYLRLPWGEKAEQIYGKRPDGYRGVLNYSVKELTNLIFLSQERGWRFTAHATGGGAVDVLLDAFEAVNMISSTQDRHHSIIHGNFFTKESLERMKTLDIYAEVQPPWSYLDSKLIYSVLPEEQAKTFHDYRSILESGVMICGGSDHMVMYDPINSINPYSPFLNIWHMVTKESKYGFRDSTQTISRIEALRAFTINNAKLSFEEKIKGTIEAGKLADIILLDRDPLTCSNDELKKTKVLLTIMNGEIVYQNELFKSQ